MTNSYNATIKIDTENNIIIGNEKVKLKNNQKREVDSLYFNLYLNGLSEECAEESSLCYPEYLDNVYKYGKNYGSIHILNVMKENEDLEFSVDKTVLCVKLKEPIKADGEISLTINFDAKIPDICYRTGGNDKIHWVGSFLPSLYGFGNENSNDKTKFIRGLSFYDGFSDYSVTVSVSKDYSVIGSGVSKVSEQNNEKIVTFNGNVVRDFAFAYGKELKNKFLILDNGINLDFYYYSDDIDCDKVISKAESCIK